MIRNVRVSPRRIIVVAAALALFIIILNSKDLYKWFLTCPPNVQAAAAGWATILMGLFGAVLAGLLIRWNFHRS